MVCCLFFILFHYIRAWAWMNIKMNVLNYVHINLTSSHYPWHTNITQRNTLVWFLKIILSLYWGYIVTFTKVLTMYRSWIHPSIILLYPPSSIPGIVSTGLHTWVHNIPTVFVLLHLFLYPLSPIQPPRQDLFYFAVFHFWMKGIFCLFKIAVQGGETHLCLSCEFGLFQTCLAAIIGPWGCQWFKYGSYPLCSFCRLCVFLEFVPHNWLWPTELTLLVHSTPSRRTHLFFHTHLIQKPDAI
jgi:hypothetical protein